MRVRQICVALAIAAACGAQTTASLVMEPEPAAAPAVERLPNSARTVLENKRDAYLRLPSGFCIDAYRALRARELFQQRESRKRDEELESLGFIPDEHKRFVQIRVKEVYIQEDGRIVSAVGRATPPSGTDRIVRLEDLPDWADMSGWTATPRDTGWTLFMDLPGFPELRFVAMRGDGTITAAIEPAPDASYVGDAAQRVQDGHPGLSPQYRRTEVIVRGPFRDMNLIRGHRLTGNYLLYPSVNPSASEPAFDLLYLDDITPTVAELAEAIEQGKAEIVTYRYTRAHAQPTKKIRPNGNKGWTETKTVNDGPPVTSYRYRRTVVPVRFLSRAASAAPAAPAPRTRAEPADDADMPDTIFLTDGRTFRGRFVRESEAEAVFVVIVGGIRQEMTFAQSDIDRIERGEQ